MVFFFISANVCLKKINDDHETKKQGPKCFKAGECRPTEGGSRLTESVNGGSARHVKRCGDLLNRRVCATKVVWTMRDKKIKAQHFSQSSVLGSQNSTK